MYIRRKVFSVYLDEETGEERLFSTTEFINEERYFNEEYVDEDEIIEVDPGSRKDTLVRAGIGAGVGTGAGVGAGLLVTKNKAVNDYLRNKKNSVIDNLTKRRLDSLDKRGEAYMDKIANREGGNYAEKLDNLYKKAERVNQRSGKLKKGLTGKRAAIAGGTALAVSGAAAGIASRRKKSKNKQ